MSKKVFDVTCTLVYNGHIEVEADDEESAIYKAYGEMRRMHFPRDIENFSFGEATADFADCIDNGQLTHIGGANGYIEINGKGLIRIVGDKHYKSSKSFEELEDDEIAYVSEAYFEGEIDEDKFYTKEYILNVCPLCTKKQIMEYVGLMLKGRGIYINEDIVEDIARNLYYSVDWECISTRAEETDLYASTLYILKWNSPLKFKKTAYFNDSEDIEALLNATADEVVESLEKGQGKAYTDIEHTDITEGSVTDFEVTENGEYIVVWDTNSDNAEDRFIDIYKRS